MPPPPQAAPHAQPLLCSPWLGMLTEASTLCSLHPPWAQHRDKLESPRWVPSHRWVLGSALSAGVRPPAHLPARMELAEGRWATLGDSLYLGWNHPRGGMGVTGAEVAGTTEHPSPGALVTAAAKQLVATKFCNGSVAVAMAASLF